MRILLALLSLGFVGCTTLSQNQSLTLLQASRAYDDATRRMTKEELLTLLGQPSISNGAVYTWKTTVADRNFESITAEFDEDGSVRKITRVSNRFTSAGWGRGEITRESAR